MAAGAGGHGVPEEHPGAARVRAGQIRQLHRAAAAWHQPEADRLRVRPDRGLNTELIRNDAGD